MASSKPSANAVQDPASVGVYGGIRRLPYFGTLLALNGATIATWMLVLLGDPTGKALFPVMLFWAFAGLALIWFRLKNIGMNPWWCLLATIPVLNILVGFRCLCCQEGWVETGRLDHDGTVVATVLLIILMIPLVLMLLVFLVSMIG